MPLTRDLFARDAAVRAITSAPARCCSTCRCISKCLKDVINWPLQFDFFTRFLSEFYGSHHNRVRFALSLYHKHRVNLITFRWAAHVFAVARCVPATCPRAHNVGTTLTHCSFLRAFLPSGCRWTYQSQSLRSFRSCAACWWRHLRVCCLSCVNFVRFRVLAAVTANKASRHPCTQRIT